MKAKYLRVTMPNGQKYDIPAKVIANNRATYYADKEGKGKYQEEYDFTLNDKFELQDWAANNMNWEDVEDLAELVKENKQKVDFQEGWINGEKEIIEK
jgi:hypothetical protein